MAPHSSTLAWKISWVEEPGRLQSMRSLRVGHDWTISFSLFTFMHCRRKWQPTPVFLPGESQGQGSLVGCHLWGRRVRHNWSNFSSSSSRSSYPYLDPIWISWLLWVPEPQSMGMAAHSSILAWRFPWTQKSDRLQSMRLPRVGHDWSNWVHART